MAKGEVAQRRAASPAPRGPARQAPEGGGEEQRAQAAEDAEEAQGGVAPGAGWRAARVPAGAGSPAGARGPAGSAARRPGRRGSRRCSPGRSAGGRAGARIRAGQRGGGAGEVDLVVDQGAPQLGDSQGEVEGHGDPHQGPGRGATPGRPLPVEGARLGVRTGVPWKAYPVPWREMMNCGMGGVRLDLLPQAADVDLEVGPQAGPVCAPDLGDQLPVGDHPAGVDGEVGQEAELGGADVHVLPVPHHPLPVQVDRQAPAVEGDLALRDVRPAPAPEVGPHAGAQLAHAEGLGDVVVRAGVQALHDLRLVAQGGDHDDRHVGQLAQALAQLVAVHARHQHVHQHRVRAPLQEAGDPFRGVRGAEDLEAGPRVRPSCKQLLDLPVVVDHQDAPCSRPAPSPAGAAGCGWSLITFFPRLPSAAIPVPGLQALALEVHPAPARQPAHARAGARATRRSAPPAPPCW